jgi:hypothetical protein
MAKVCRSSMGASRNYPSRAFVRTLESAASMTFVIHVPEVYRCHKYQASTALSRAFSITGKTMI